MTARENAETADLTLEVERLRGELAASQGMRESLLATLKLANDTTGREMAKVQSLTEQLAEATGLLERIREATEDCDENDPDEARQCVVDVFHMTAPEKVMRISRAPAQATEAERLRGAIASTDRYLSGAPAQAAEPDEQQKRIGMILDAKQRWIERAESAEAKLAAVRGVTRWQPCEVEPAEDEEDGPVYQGFLTDPAGAWVKWEDIADLLAPSQGEGGGGNG
jgi:hypothetical protein